LIKLVKRDSRRTNRNTYNVGDLDDSREMLHMRHMPVLYNNVNAKKYRSNTAQGDALPFDD